MVTNVMRIFSFIFTLILVALLPETEAHQAFNAQEEVRGGYRISLSTDPEIPGPNNPTLLRIDVTDPNYNMLVDVRVGLKIFKNELLVHEVNPRIDADGHMDIQYSFPESGMYIVEVDVFDPYGKEIAAKFNVGVIQTFGYIFYSMVLVGAFFPAAVLGIIFLKRRKARQTQR
ncbi:MAG: hypothetical protein QXU32_06990 [Nitrososphaerales archaeon]